MISESGGSLGNFVLVVGSILGIYLSIKIYRSGKMKGEVEDKNNAA